ncbi:MAG TPA: hypothetical protein VIV57_25315 [Anaeromyxobacter sp.]
MEQLVGVLRGQRVDAELPVVRLASPAVPVLGPVVHREQDGRRRQALHEPVEEALGLPVDPVQVFEQQHQRLHAALAQEQALGAVDGAAPSQRGLEGQESVVDR